MIKVPFRTHDSQLAAILDMMGEKPIRVWNCYSEAKLRELGCSTIREAKTRRLAGRVWYFFDHTERAEKISAAYYDQQKRNKDRVPSETEIDYTTGDLVRLLISGFMMRKEYATLWMEAPTKLGDYGEGVAESEDALTLTQADAEELNRAGKRNAAGAEFRAGDVLSGRGKVNYPAIKIVDITTDPKLRSKFLE